MLELLGRRDGQVKVRGFRVELAEVEEAICSCPGVIEAAVVAREDGVDGQRLIACIVGDGEQNPGCRYDPTISPREGTGPDDPVADPDRRRPCPEPLPARLIARAWRNLCPMKKRRPRGMSVLVTSSRHSLR